MTSPTQEAHLAFAERFSAANEHVHQFRALAPARQVAWPETNGDDDPGSAALLALALSTE